MRKSWGKKVFFFAHLEKNCNFVCNLQSKKIIRWTHSVTTTLPHEHSRRLAETPKNHLPPARVKNLPKKPTKWLSVVAALTLLTGVAALVVLLINMHHTSLGGVHGKIGLLMLAIVIGHTIKRAKFLKK